MQADCCTAVRCRRGQTRGCLGCLEKDLNSLPRRNLLDPYIAADGDFIGAYARERKQTILLGPKSAAAS
jgi:hypothetical protein